MDRRVQRQLIEAAYEKYGRIGLERKSDVSARTWDMARKDGRVPKTFRIRQKMSDALNVTEEQLFPLVTTKERAKAS